MENLNQDLYEKITGKKREERPVKVLQFGEGNFLRAFCDWIINTMNKKGVFNGNVCVVQPMSFGRVEDMKKQDGLYTLYLQGKQNGQKVRTHEIIDCISDLINPFTEYSKYLDYAKSSDLQFIISNTTEAGIAYDETDTDFTKTPKSYPGKLLAFLKARYDHFNGSKEAGLYILPCELIDHNGSTLKEVVVKLAHTCGYDEKFISWITEANKFYNTLVDRIVPGYPRDNAKECEAELGYVDNSMVVGEIFHLWCIDGDDIKSLEEVFPAPKADLNVLYVNSIVPYKQRKVKILNGTHTAIVPVAYLSGIDSVAETMADPQLGKYARDFMFDEVIPTIDIPHDQMVDYANSVIERYENPFVHHLLMSIALNSVTKFKTRDLPTALQSIETHNFPKHALFSLAALIAFYKGERVVNGKVETINLQDDEWALDFFKKEWANFDGSKEACAKIVKDFLGLEKHWEQDLNKVEGVTEYVTNALYEIETNGMRQAIKNVIGC
jgi:tagaturonate reductase